PYPCLHLFFLLLPLPLISTLFPYTTLFRSFLQVRQRRPGVEFAPVFAMGGIVGKMLQSWVGITGHAVKWQWLDHPRVGGVGVRIDRKSTRLNSSHSQISYAVFCLKKKKKKI